MSAWNVPDDWDSYWVTCPTCGTRWHESETHCWCEMLTDEEREELHDNIERAAFERQEYEDRDDCW